MKTTPKPQTRKSMVSHLRRSHDEAETSYPDGSPVTLEHLKEMHEDIFHERHHDIYGYRSDHTHRGL